MTRTLSLVTGSTSGIGQALCRQLLQNGHDLVLLNRDMIKTRSQAETLLQRFPDATIDMYQADFADQNAIRAAAQHIGAAHDAIDEIYLVAGALSDRGQMSTDGLELHFAVNCIAPLLLVRLLRTQLRAAGGQVVVAGSAARKMVRKLISTEAAQSAGQGGMTAYAQSKQAITVAFSALRDRYAEDDIGLHVVDLAPTKTGMAASPALPLPFRLFRFLFSSPEASARRLMAAASSAPAQQPLPYEAADVAALMTLIDGSTPAPAMVA